MVGQPSLDPLIGPPHLNLNSMYPQISRLLQSPRRQNLGEVVQKRPREWGKMKEWHSAHTQGLPFRHNSPTPDLATPRSLGTTFPRILQLVAATVTPPRQEVQK